jgi:von Willebrand factor type A domain
MSAFGRAGALSLGLHVAVVAGICIGLARPRPARPVGAPTRARKVMQDIGVVTLAAPERKPAPAPPQVAPPVPLGQPVAVSQPPLPVPPPLPRAIMTLPETDVRPVAHTEPATTPSRPAPAAQASGPATPSFFSVRVEGKSVVYVIDRSSSMGEGRFDRAREQVIASLRQLPPDARFQVIAYDRNAIPLNIGGRGLAAATVANVEAASAALVAMFPEGATDHVRALKQALLLRPDVIYFLTDEDDLTAADVTQVTQFNRRVGASIHTLCLVAPTAADTPMRRLARENRGIFRIVQ